MNNFKNIFILLFYNMKHSTNSFGKNFRINIFFTVNSVITFNKPFLLKLLTPYVHTYTSTEKNVYHYY